MKTAAVLLLSCLLGAPLWAQSVTPIRSVWMEDYTAETVEAAVASGKTTLIYSGGSSMAVANHVQVARYVAQRVAEELAQRAGAPRYAGRPGVADFPAACRAWRARRRLRQS